MADFYAVYPPSAASSSGSNPSVGPTGDPVPADATFIGGVDGNGDLIGVAVDTDGELQVDVISSTLPAGAATAANQVTEIGLLTTIDADTGSIATSTASIDTKTPALGQAAMTASVPVAIANDQSAIPISDGGGVITVDGTVTANQGGSWTVNAVQDGSWTVAATQSGVWTVDISAASTVSVENLPTTVATNVGAADASTLRVSEGARSFADSVYYNYASGSVTTGAWVELDSATAAAINLMFLTDQSGEVMELGAGAAAAEVRIFLIPRGFSGQVPLRIASGTRLSVRAVSGTASTGELVITGLQ